jgi:adenylate kinase family enzyme
MKITDYKNIFVYGDAGRGKTTLSKKISEYLDYPILHLDDVYWEEWLTKERDKGEQGQMIIEFLDANCKWVIEGCTRSRHKAFLHDVDLIIYLKYKNIFQQLFTVWKRAKDRNEPFHQVMSFSINLIKKNYKLGKYKNKPNFKESISEYNGDMIEFSSFEEIDNFVKENLV